MTETPLALLAKLNDGEGTSVSHSELLTIAQYLGVDFGSQSLGSELALLRDELSKQNAFLSTEMESFDAARSDMYIRSHYVRELVDQAAKRRSKTLRPSKRIDRAKVQNLEKALLVLCDVVEYPLFVANEIGDKRIIEFVAELAADIFRRVQLDFKELERQLENEATVTGSLPKMGDQEPNARPFGDEEVA